jgi:hypothetical protein
LPLTAQGLPAYFLEIPGGLHGSSPQPDGARVGGPPIPPSLRSHETLQVMATATGQVAAPVRLPGYVTATAASAGAFFAAVVTGPVARFYVIRLAAGGTSATATKLPIPADTAPIGFIAASPDGSKLAISTYVRHGPASDIQNLIVAATATGAERRWMTPAQDSQGSMGTMAWLADGKTLAFSWTGTSDTSPSSTLRLLDTTAAGDDLLSSTAVLPLVNRVGAFGDYTISPDRKVVIGIPGCLPGCPPGDVGTIRGHKVAPGSVIQFSAATGNPSVLYEEPPLPGTSGHFQNSACTDPLWISNSGRKVLLTCFQHRSATSKRRAKTVIHVVLLDNGRVRQLPWLAATAYEITAFPGITAFGGIPAFPLNP